MRTRATGCPSGSFTSGSSETSQPAWGLKSLKLSHSMVLVSRKNSRIRLLSSLPNAGGPDGFHATFSAWKIGFGCGRWKRMTPSGCST